MVECKPSKLEAWVRVPLSAHKKITIFRKKQKIKKKKMAEERPEKSETQTSISILKNENGLIKFISQYLAILFLQIYISVQFLNSFFKSEEILNAFLIQYYSFLKNE